MARRYGILVRVSELNSVTCGGVQGASNTFATALWAPDALFELVRAGVKGADVHVRVFSINAPFTGAPGIAYLIVAIVLGAAYSIAAQIARANGVGRRRSRNRQRNRNRS